VSRASTLTSRNSVALIVVIDNKCSQQQFQPHKAEFEETPLPERNFEAKAAQLDTRAQPNSPQRNTRPPVSVGVLNEHLGYFMRRAQVWIFNDFIRTLSEIEIRPAQYSVLVVIGENPGLSQSDLARTLGIERARLVHMLDLLGKRGWTERQPAPSDRRSHALFLTRDGQKMLRKAKALAAEHEAHLTERLGAANRKLMLDLMREVWRGRN
jgi:DNA-binding MarR family transcriptional regulator